MSFCRGCIVKSFHCHRRAYEGLMNEGASVRNTLPPLPLLPWQYLPKLSGPVPSSPALPFSDQPRCTRQPPRLQPLVESAPGFFLFSIFPYLTQRKTCKWDLVASAQKAGRAGLEVVQNLCRYFSLVCIDLLLSPGKQQQQQRDAREGRGGRGSCLYGKRL